MSYGDPFTFDDLQRAYDRREPLALSVDQVRDLVEGWEAVNEDAVDAAYDDGYSDGAAAFEENHDCRAG